MGEEEGGGREKENKEGGEKDEKREEGWRGGMG